MFDTIRECFGCPNSKIRKHAFDWSLGPNVPTQVDEATGVVFQESYLGGPGMWWMYCTKCGYEIWSNQKD